MKKKVIISLIAALILAVLVGCGCKDRSAGQYNLNLEVWGPIDDSYTYQEIFETYKKTNPNIKEIIYKRLPADTYQKELLEALASGQGPDIFMVHNTWIPSYADKIVSAPIDVFTEKKFRSDFVDVCAQDFIAANSIWAAPLSVDSLGLYYNKDLFNEAGIASPPTDWNQFLEDVQRLTKMTSSREIKQSGAALGTAYNINRSTDVLNFLMLQSGTDMVDSNGSITMGGAKMIDGNAYFPAQKALSLYTQFAQSSSPYYTWNPRLHYSIDAFSEGTVAMMLNYSWHIQTIKNKSPKLNFAIAPVPQVSGTLPVNYANYWGFAVAKNKVIQGNVSNNTRVSEAWKFIKFLTTRPEGNLSAASSTYGAPLGGGVDSNFDPAATYLSKTGAPAARRDLIEKQSSDPMIGVFARDNLIAKSWQQSDPLAMESIMAEMINQVNLGQFQVAEAIESASQRMNQLGK